MACKDKASYASSPPCKSCHIWDLTHQMWKKIVFRINESCHIWMSHITYETTCVISHITHVTWLTKCVAAPMSHNVTDGRLPDMHCHGVHNSQCHRWSWCRICDIVWVMGNVTDTTFSFIYVNVTDATSWHALSHYVCDVTPCSESCHTHHRVTYVTYAIKCVAAPMAHYICDVVPCSESCHTYHRVTYVTNWSKCVAAPMAHYIYHVNVCVDSDMSFETVVSADSGSRNVQTIDTIDSIAAVPLQSWFQRSFAGKTEFSQRALALNSCRRGLFRGRRCTRRHEAIGRVCRRLNSTVFAMLVFDPNNFVWLLHISHLHALSAQESLIIGLFCRRWTIKIRHPASVPPSTSDDSCWFES